MAPNKAKTNRFTTASRLVLAFCVALILLNAFQIVYRYQTLTDGWLWHSGALGSKEQNDVLYDANLVGEPSPLHPGDRVTAVAGFPVMGGDLSQAQGAAARLASLRAGDQVEYHLLRGNQALNVQVPLTHWTVVAWVRANSSLYILILNLSSLLLLAIGFSPSLKGRIFPAHAPFWSGVR